MGEGWIWFKQLHKKPNKIFPVGVKSCWLFVAVESCCSFFFMSQSLLLYPSPQFKLEQNGQDTGIRKFMEKVKEENGNKLIIFDQDR